MNYIWSAMLIIALICGFCGGCINETVSAAFDGAGAAVEIILSLTGILCFWTGMLKIAERSGVSGAVQRILSPVVKLLFKNAPEKAKEYMTMNIAANMLGMGNAATPMGIRAMSELDKVNARLPAPSKDMCTFMVLNTASVQLIPTTIMAIRRAAGSASPEAVIVPVLVGSFAGCAAAVAAVKFFIRR